MTRGEEQKLLSSLVLKGHIQKCYICLHFQRGRVLGRFSAWHGCYRAAANASWAPPPVQTHRTVSCSQMVCSHELFFSSCSACSRNNFTKSLKIMHVYDNQKWLKIYSFYWLNQVILLGSLAIFGDFLWTNTLCISI